MAIRVESTPPEKARADVLIVPVLQESGKSREVPAHLRPLDKALQGQIQTALGTKAFSGKLQEVRSLIRPGKSPAPRVILIGLGAKESCTEESVRRAAAAAGRASSRIRSAAISLRGIPGSVQSAAEAAVTGYRMAGYRFTRFKSGSDGKPARKPSLVLLTTEKKTAEARKGARVAEAVVSGLVTARDLANTPGNHMTPTHLGRAAAAMARKVGLRSQVLTEKRMHELGMGSLLSVSRGSVEPAKLIILEHGRKRKGRPTICLVGKGLTFDTGGISLKPPGDMDKMRYDMCGGAGMIGTMEAVARLKLPLHVVGIIPSSENMPGAQATKPGDIVTAMNGKTIEVLNTDAEGRLILADALCYAERFKPDLVVDMATLTGAVVVALGKHMAGMMGTDQKAMDRLRDIGTDVWERVWQLPLDDDYDKAMRGKSGDLQNIGGRNAGTITAGQFLKHFVGEMPWIHLDIAGMAYDDVTRVYNKGSGATGFGVRLLTRFLQEWPSSRG